MSQEHSGELIVCIFLMLLMIANQGIVLVGGPKLNAFIKTEVPRLYKQYNGTIMTLIQVVFKTQTIK